MCVIHTHTVYNDCISIQLYLGNYVYVSQNVSVMALEVKRLIGLIPP